MNLKRLCVTLATCCFLLQVPVFAGEVPAGDSGNIGIYVNGGKKVEYENTCFIKNGVVYVPLRETIENYDGSIEYKKPSILIVLNNNDIEMNPSKKDFTMNGVELSFLHMPEILNGVTYMSIIDINTVDGNFYEIENEIGKDGEYTVLMRKKERSAEKKASIDRDYSFDLKLLKEFSKNENSVVSPVSLKVVLAMTANGTAGETQKQILDALNINDLNDFNEKIKNADKERYDSAKWVSSNSIWVQ